MSFFPPFSVPPQQPNKTFPISHQNLNPELLTTVEPLKSEQRTIDIKETKYFQKSKKIEVDFW